MKSKTFLKILTFTLVFAAVFSLSVYSAAQTNEAEAAGADFRSGVVKYILDKVLPEAPNTLEFVVKIDKNAEGEIGNLFSNESMANASQTVGLSVNENGYLCLEWNSYEKYVIFDGCDLRNGEWTHVAVVRDAEKGGFSYYVNGKHMQTVTCGIGEEITEFYMEHAIGGDYNSRQKDKRPFNGSVKQVTLYADALTAGEVARDYTNGSAISYKNRDNLLFNVTLLSSSVCAYDTSMYQNNAYLASNDYFYEDELFEAKDYTLAIVPDIQMITLFYPEMVATLPDYLLQHQEEQKIEAVFTVGDLTNGKHVQGSSFDKQYKTIADEFAKLDGAMPYIFVPGNHDYDDECSTSKGLTYLNKYLTIDKMSQWDEWGDSFSDDSIINAYYKMEYEGVKYLVFALDFGPSDEVLEWCCEVTEQNPDHRVILLTHGFLHPDGRLCEEDMSAAPEKYGFSNYVDVNCGANIWDKWLKKYPNVFMTFCGHVISDDIIVEETVGDNGNVVANFLINGQGLIMSDGLESLVALFNFDEQNQLVYVNYVSTVQDKLYNFQNQFVYDFKGNTTLTSTKYSSTSTYTISQEETLSAMADRTGLFSTNLSADSGQTLATGSSITVEPSPDGSTVADVSSAAEGQTVNLTAYPIYNRELDYFTVNGEKIEGSSFTMPAGSVTVGAVYKEVYAETDVSLTITTSYQTATSYWYAKYTAFGIEIRAVVDDTLVFTSKKGTTNVALADNIEFIIGIKGQDSSFTNKTYKMLVNAEGEYFFQQGNGTGFNTINSGGIQVETKRLDVFTHGFLGYEATVTIPYSMLGTTYQDAYGRLCICPAMRNTTNTLKTAWASYSGMNCNWSVPSTHLLIETDGKMVMNVNRSDYLFAGDETLAYITTVSGMDVMKNSSAYTVPSSKIRYWINNMQDILRYQAGEVYFTCGREDIESTSVLEAFIEMREFITFFRSATDAKLNIVSCIPSIYSRDPEAIAAFNLMVREYTEQINGVEFIDFCQDVYSDGQINESFYGSATTLSDEGHLLLKKRILTARGAYTEENANSDWGSTDSYVMSGNWTYENGKLIYRNGGSSYVYYKGGAYSDFVFECYVTASQIYNGDQYPKFGIKLINENHCRLYYISAVGITEQIAGVVERPYSGYDWVNGDSFAVKDMVYKSPDYVKLKIVKSGSEILFLINDQAVATTLADDFGDAPVTFGLFSFNLSLDVEDIRIVTDPELVQKEVEG